MLVDIPGLTLGFLLIAAIVWFVVRIVKRQVALEDGLDSNRKSGLKLPRDQVEAAVKVELAHASKAAVGRNPPGNAHIPILVDDQIVGNLWEDADLSKLKVGSYWAGPRGQQVQLVKGDHVVGMIRVTV